MVFTDHNFDNPQLLIDLVSSILSSEPTKLQHLLETFDLQKRAEKLLVLLEEEIEIATLQEKIRHDIKEKVDKQQKAP